MRILKVMGVVLAVLALALGGAELIMRLNTIPHERWEAPRRGYRVTLYRQASLLALLPGRELEGPGVLRLEDSQGKVLQEKRVSRLDRVQDVRWSSGKVEVAPLVQWDLPEPW